MVGERHFKTLRREATSALIGPENHISSWLAMQVISPHLQDPLLYVVTTAVTFLRRLFHSNPNLAQDFWSSVHSHSATAVGPAGALARYLNLLGWSLSDDGTLT